MHQVEQLSIFTQAALAYKSFITTNSIGIGYIKKSIFHGRQRQWDNVKGKVTICLCIWISWWKSERGGYLRVCVTVQFALCAPQSTLYKKSSVLYIQKKKYACPLHLSPLSYCSAHFMHPKEVLEKWLRVLGSCSINLSHLPIVLNIFTFSF